MEAAVIEAGAVPVEVIKERFLDAMARNLSKPVSGVKTLWGVTVEKVSSSSVFVNYVRPAFAWTSNVVSKAAGYLGWVGGIGLGLLAATTDIGRNVINKTVGTAIRTAGRVIRTGYRWVGSILNHLGTPGRWVKAAIDTGVAVAASGVNKATDIWNKSVFHHVEVGSPVMESVRGIGMSMVLIKVAMLIPNPWIAVPAWILAGIVTAYAAIFTADVASALVGIQGDEYKAETLDYSRQNATERGAARVAKSDAKAAKKAAKDVAKPVPPVATQVVPEPEKVEIDKEIVEPDAPVDEPTAPSEPTGPADAPAGDPATEPVDAPADPVPAPAEPAGESATAPAESAGEKVIMLEPEAASVLEKVLEENDVPMGVAVVFKTPDAPAPKLSHSKTAKAQRAAAAADAAEAAEFSNGSKQKVTAGRRRR